MLYAQDLTVGQRFQFGTYRMEEAEIIEFATRYDPLYIHIDREAAANGPFGGVIASGIHTLAIYQRLLAEAMWWDTAIIAGKQFQAKLLRPVRPGDVLTGHAEVEGITIRAARNNAILTLGSVITDGVTPVMTVHLESVIGARPA